MAQLAPSISRSPNLWFDDGSLVLEVEATQFRIHRSILCANSVVFRDMHEMSEPGERDTVDACPLVVLQGDTAADWDNLLGYMYFPAKGANPAEHLTFPLVSSMLRLGRKYDFSDIYSLALRTLRVQVPNDVLEVWDHVFNPTTRSWRGGKAMPMGHVPGYWLQDNEFDLVNLLIEQDIQSILPIAYYLCIQGHSLKEILCGIHRSDGSLSSLRPEALQVVLLGRHSLHRALYKITMSWLTDSDTIPVEDCAQEISEEPPERLTYCEEYRLTALKMLANLDIDYIRPLDTLDDDWYGGFCDDCSNSIIEISAEKRESLWLSLPSYFNLPPWHELMDSE